MFREKFKSEIIEVLSSKSFFSNYDFTIAANDSKKGQISIAYNHCEKYYFIFQIPDGERTKKGDYGDVNYYLYHATIAPWEAAELESVRFESKSEFLKGLNRWLGFLEEDLTSSPTNRKLKSMEEKMSSYSEMIDEIEGEYFSQEEADSLKNKIDELHVKMTESINNLDKDSNEKARTIRELKQEIEGLKTKIEILDKKGALKSLVGRILVWTSKPENQKLIGDGTTFVKGLIDDPSQTPIS